MGKQIIVVKVPWGASYNITVDSFRYIDKSPTDKVTELIFTTDGECYMYKYWVTSQSGTSELYSLSSSGRTKVSDTWGKNWQDKHMDIHEAARRAASIIHQTTQS